MGTLIMLLLLAAFLEWLIPALLPYIIGIAVIFITVAIISWVSRKWVSEESSPHSEKTSSTAGVPKTDFNHRITENISGISADVDGLKRQAQIPKDCEKIINESDNLDTVAYRYNLMIEKLQYFSSIPDDTLRRNGLFFGKPAREYLQEGTAKKTLIFCQAIERAGQKAWKHIQTLKTKKGKENALKHFRDETSDIIAKYDLPPVACLNKLEDVCCEMQAAIGE